MKAGKTAKSMSELTRLARIDDLMSANIPWAGSMQEGACWGQW